jgi:hypothetical protein
MGSGFYFRKKGVKMTTEVQADWARIGQELASPFAPEQVAWRVQGKANAGQRAQVVAYISARDVAERLDNVVGCGSWSFDWQPLHVDAAGEVQTARGVLSIHGVSKADVGTGSNFEASKGCVSDALKRCAVLWGVGRYLYDIHACWVVVDDKGRISEADLAKLRAALARRMAA